MAIAIPLDNHTNRIKDRGVMDLHSAFCIQYNSSVSSAGVSPEISAIAATSSIVSEGL